MLFSIAIILHLVEQAYAIDPISPPIAKGVFSHFPPHPLLVQFQRYAYFFFDLPERMYSLPCLIIVSHSRFGYSSSSEDEEDSSSFSTSDLSTPIHKYRFHVRMLNFMQFGDQNHFQDKFILLMHLHNKM